MVKLRRALSIAAAVLVAIAFFIGTLWALNFVTPTVVPERPTQVTTPALPQATRPSVIVAPIAIALPVIRQALDSLGVE